MLQPLASIPRSVGPNVVARLKVLAGLLTYRTDVPQEGRIQDAQLGFEVRVSTLPTLFGEKAVVRLFGGQSRVLRLAELGFAPSVAQRWSELVRETSGMLIITGPAGSGKTTTAYALMREIVEQSQGGRSAATLEDPVELALPGVSQTQANPMADFDLSGALKFLLRQDPEVIMVGEMRDAETARLAFQAAVTGHLVVSTFHAGSAAEAVSRLADMGIPPYMLRSGLLAIVSQRLLRRLCTCSLPAEQGALEGLPVQFARVAKGCDACLGTGYHGRVPVAELLEPAGEVGRAILSRTDADRVEALAIQAGMVPIWQQALARVEAGDTSPQEVVRVFGRTHLAVGS
ncbi:MAG: GspE/PulE family protein [Pirellulales bacterium]|nr:GspE/PulE family protein [Pirellulales bacterium]